MTLLHLFVCSFFAFANTDGASPDSIRYLNPNDTLFIKLDVNNDKLLVHLLKRGQTLFSTARFYGISLQDLYWMNPSLKDKPYLTGQEILIPLPNKAIIRYQAPGFVKRNHVPLYYTIRKGDTMFSLSKVHFMMPPDTIRKRLGNPTDDLIEGQQLLVGWMHIRGIPAEWHDGTPVSNVPAGPDLAKIYAEEVKTKKEISEQGKAFWQKNNRDDQKMYALHRYAEINSVILIRNPMNNRVVYARVIDRIPDTVYEKEVIVVLSPMAARQLGAQDSRFFARVKYYQ